MTAVMSQRQSSGAKERSERLRLELAVNLQRVTVCFQLAEIAQFSIFL
jgi:hypothetical protein